MPAPSAMFSPFTMQTSAPSSLAQRRQPLLDGAPPGDAEDVCEKEDLSSGPATLRGGSRSRRGCPGRSCTARAPAVRRPRGRRRCRARRAADDVRAELERRIGDELRERHDERRCALRLDVDARSEAMPADDVRRDADDRAVDRCVHVRPGTAPTSSADGEPPSSRTRPRRAAAAAEDLVEEALHDAFVPLVPDRRAAESRRRSPSGSRWR